MAQALGAADGPGVRQASATPPGGVYPPSELGSGFRHLFELLPSHVQRDTMGQLTDSELGAFLEQTKNDQGKVSLDVLSAIADSNPTALNQRVEKDPLLMNQLTEFLKTSEGQSVQVIQSLTVKNAGECAKNDELKAAIKTHHPVGYMGSVLADVRNSKPPESSLNVVLNAYGLTDEVLSKCETDAEKLRLLTTAFESLGRAGNQNPEMMSQLLSELSVSNHSSPEMQTRLVIMFGKLIDASDPRVGIELIKNAMVGAMFKDNSLNVCLTLDHLPQNIQDQLTSLSKNDALRDAFQEGFNEYDQTRFDGLRFGLSAASLTSYNAKELVESKRVFQRALGGAVLSPDSSDQSFDLGDAKDVRDCLLNFDPAMIGANDIPALNQFLTTINQALETSSKGLTTDLSALKTLVCARGYALTQSNVQATSSGSPELMDAANAFKEGLGVHDGQSFKEQAAIINQKIDEVAVVVLGMRSTTGTPIGDFFWALVGGSKSYANIGQRLASIPNISLNWNREIISSSRDVNRHRFTALKSQVNVVNEKTAMNIDDFMDQGTPFSNEVEAAIFLEKVIADNQQDNESSLIYSNREPNMDKLSTTFKRFAQVQKQFPQLRTKSVKDFEKQMAQKAVSGDKKDFDSLFKNASVGAQQQLIATMGASDSDGAKGLKADAASSRSMEKLHAPSSDFVQSSDIDHAQQTMVRQVSEELATLPTKELKEAYLIQLTQQVGRLPFNQGPAKNSVMLARLRGIQQAAQKGGLNTEVFDTSVSTLLDSMSVEQLPLSDRSMDHMLTFMTGRSNDDNGPMLATLLVNSPKDFDRLQARASIHSNGSAVTKAMSDIRSQQYRSGENMPSFVVTRESSNISKMSYTDAVHEGIELANNQELSDTAKGEILAQLMIDSPTNFLAVMEGLQNHHGKDKDNMTNQDRMVASGMHRIANDPGLYRLFTNIQHGNFDSGRSSSRTMDYIESMMDNVQYLTESGISTLTRGHMDGSNAGLLTRGVVGAGALTVGIAASPLYVLGKGIYQVGKFFHQKVTGRPKPLKIRGAGSRQRIMRQVVQHLADHSSSMGTVNTMLIGQGVNRHRDTINLMASIGPERMATMVKAGGLEPQAMTSMSKSMAALSMHDNELLLPFKPFSPNEIYDGSDISTAIQTLKSALTTAAQMGEQVQAPEAAVISTQLTPEQDYGRSLLTSALQVTPRDLGIHEDDSNHPKVQKFMDRMAHHAFDTMRHDSDQMAQILNTMLDKSPAMKGVALSALPMGDNSGLLDSLSRLEATPQKPALQAMACLIRPKGARVADAMAGGSGIRFNVDAAAHYLSSASEGNQQVATQFIKAMNYAIDHGLVTNTELHELYQKTDMDRLIGHCLVLKGDDTPKDEGSTRLGRGTQCCNGFF